MPKECQNTGGQKEYWNESHQEEGKKQDQLRWETYIGHAMADRDLSVGDWKERDLWRAKTVNS